MQKARTDAVLAIIIFVLCLAVYNATLTPSLSYKSPDGNELATVCYTLGLAHSTGYPLYTWLGKLFTLLPIGDAAHRVNLMSAVLGAAGVALLYLILRDLTGGRSLPASRLASAFGALLFGFSLTFWSQAGIAEVYAPNLFMVAITLLLLLRWARACRAGVPRDHLWLWAFALAYGLSLGTHMSNLGFAPAFALFIFLVDRRLALRPWIWLTAASFFFLGVLQFLWLPYKAGTLNDTLMLRNAPTTLKGIYDYTLGAFPNFKFAFPLQAIPERIVLYLYLLAQNFSLAGIVAGVAGMGALLWRAPRRFFLLMGIYLVQVWFFVQYRAFDLDVFFIPAHFIFAIFIATGVYALLRGLAPLGRAAAGWKRTLGAVASVGLALVLLLGLAREVRANWTTNDRSEDTAINDFYENVFDLLPQDSALLGRGGVFGYDMFYFRLVYGYRPDVAMPMIDGPHPAPGELAGRALYTTQPAAGRGGGGPWAPPSSLLPGGSWYVPVLLGQSDASDGLPGQGRSLVLYAASPRPPELVVDWVDPDNLVDRELGGLALVGYDVDTGMAVPGGRLHLRLYWRADEVPRSLVVTRLGGMPLEAHELGLGNLTRYVQQVRPLQGGVIVEDYWIVVPSTLAPGNHPLQVGLSAPLVSEQGGDGLQLQLGTVTVAPSSTHGEE